MPFQYCALSNYTSPAQVPIPTAAALMRYSSACNGDNGQLIGEVYATPQLALAALANTPANVAAANSADPPTTIPAKPQPVESFSISPPPSTSLPLANPTLPADVQAIWSTLTPTSQAIIGAVFALPPALLADMEARNLSQFATDLGYLTLQVQAATDPTLSRFVGTNT